MASTVMRLADALPIIENEEGLRQAATEILVAVGDIRRLLETQAGAPEHDIAANRHPSYAIVSAKPGSSA